jgi:hypothetical protein
MTALEALADGLKANGFDGLVVPGSCGCERDDLSPGDCLGGSCEAAYKHTHSVTGEWIMSLRRDHVTDDAITAIAEMCS